MNRLSIFVVGASVAAAAPFALLPRNAAAQNQIIEDANKQLSRQISDSISRRTSVRLTSDAIGTAAAAGSPTMSDKKSSFWVNSTYTNISADLTATVDGDPTRLEADLDLYQSSVGLDHRFGKFFAGVSGSFTRADVSASATTTTRTLSSSSFSSFAGTSGLGATTSGNTSRFDGGLNNYAVNPYVGYMITPYLYPLAILGYSRSDIDDTNIDADALSSDLSMNYSDRIGNWIARGKLGWRYLRVTVNVPGSESDSTNVNTLVAGATVGYKAGMFLPYLTAQYERLLTTIDVPQNVVGVSPDYNFFYLTAGVDVDIIPDLTIGVAGQVEAVNSITDTYSAIFNLRFRF